MPINYDNNPLITKLDPVLDACWDYEVVSRDIFPVDVFWTPPIYEAVLQLQEYYIFLDLKARGIV